MQQSCPHLVGAWRWIKGLNLGLKHGENGIGRIARLDQSGQAMSGNVLLRPLFVLLQSVRKDGLGVWGRR